MTFVFPDAETLEEQRLRAKKNQEENGKYSHFPHFNDLVIECPAFYIYTQDKAYHPWICSDCLLAHFPNFTFVVCFAKNPLIRCI